MDRTIAKSLVEAMSSEHKENRARSKRQRLRKVAGR